MSQVLLSGLNWRERVAYALLSVLLSVSSRVVGQDFGQPATAPTARAVEVSEAPFHRAVLKAATELVRKGELRRVDMIRLRVAMLSPGFRKHAEDLAVVQMSASGSDNVPIGDDGRVDRASINWEGLLAFLEKLIPLLLALLDALSQAEQELIDFVGLTMESWA